MFDLYCMGRVFYFEIFEFGSLALFRVSHCSCCRHHRHHHHRPTGLNEEVKETVAKDNAERRESVDTVRPPGLF